MKKMIPIKGSIFFKRPDKSAVTSAIGLGSFCASCWVMFSNIQCSFEHLSILTVFLQIQVDLRRPSNQPSLQNSYCNQGEIFIFQKTFFGFQKDLYQIPSTISAPRPHDLFHKNPNSKEHVSCMRQSGCARLKVSRAGWGHPLMTKQSLDEVNWPGDNLPETLHLKTPFNMKKKKKNQDEKGKNHFFGSKYCDPPAYVLASFFPDKSLVYCHVNTSCVQGSKHFKTLKIIYENILP